MFLDMISDIDNEVLVNHSKSYYLLDTSTKIYAIFSFVKNHISFCNSKQIKKASETLVYRHGNNINKNVLLYSFFKLNKLDCNLICCFLKDNNNFLKEFNTKVIPWIYVKVKTSNKTLYLDCSFDKYFMHRTNLRYVGNRFNYLPTDYTLNNVPIFNVLNTITNLENLDILDYFYKNNNNIYHKEFCYV